MDSHGAVDSHDPDPVGAFRVGSSEVETDSCVPLKRETLAARVVRVINGHAGRDREMSTLPRRGHSFAHLGCSSDLHTLRIKLTWRLPGLRLAA